MFHEAIEGIYCEDILKYKWKDNNIYEMFLYDLVWTISLNAYFFIMSYSVVLM